MWNSWKAFVSFLFSPSPVPPSHCCCNWCDLSVWLRNGAASCDLHQTCCCASICSAAGADVQLDPQPLAAAETGSGVDVRRRVALLKWRWKHDAAPASSSQTATVSRWGLWFGKVKSQVAPMGRRTWLLILEGDPRHPAVGRQMGYATVMVTLPVFSEQSVCLCVQCVVMQLETMCDIMLSISE